MGGIRSTGKGWGAAGGVERGGGRGVRAAEEGDGGDGRDVEAHGGEARVEVDEQLAVLRAPRAQLRRALLKALHVVDRVAVPRPRPQVLHVPARRRPDRLPRRLLHPALLSPP